MQDYVEIRDGGYYLRGSRVALDGIVHAFQNGAAPENILRSFPSAGSLVAIYGALTFYLENQSQVDQYLQQQDRLAEELRSAQPPLSDALAERIRATRNETETTSQRP